MNRSINILILADGFGAPSYNPRLRALCNFLQKKQYAFSVVVEHIAELPFEHNYPIHELNIYSGRKLDWALKNIWSILTDWKNRRYSYLVEKQFGNGSFDLVFCTTFHTCPLRAAIEFGKRHHIPVITDIRDLAEQAPGNQVNYLAHQSRLLKLFVKPYQRINILRRNRQLKKADCVTTISPWHVSFIKAINPHTHLIYNGYDANILQPADIPSNQFILSYSGKYFGLPMQNPTMLFEALSQLTNISYKILFHTNPEAMPLLHKLAAQYHITNHIDIRGYISTAELVNVYHQSSIILVFSNRAGNKNVHGMMTTKFYDALGVEKPVLCVRSDEECLADVIQQTNAGLAATNTEEVKSFILAKYNEWQANGFTRQPVRNTQPFTREYQSSQFIELFQALIHHA